MPLHAATIFLSAFLLFLVQPLLAKQILPWFGGAAIVWTLCMVFFQLVLLLGYAYAHWLARQPGRRQAIVHVALLVASLAFLPVAADAAWKPLGGQSPVGRILALLFATVGLPYFLLSSTSPLVQSWFARDFPGSSPYRLFALSNFASMLALLGYPFLFEPWFASPDQSFWWSAGYALFVIACASLAWRSRELPPLTVEYGQLAAIAESGRGVMVFLHRPESAAELRQRAICDEAPASSKLELRNYGIGAQILRDLNVRKMRLMARPRKMPSMTGFDLEVTGFVEPPPLRKVS